MMIDGMNDLGASFPHSEPFQHGLDLARRVTVMIGAEMPEERLALIGAAVLCGFAATGGLSYRSRKSLKQAAARWHQVGLEQEQSDVA